MAITRGSSTATRRDASERRAMKGEGIRARPVGRVLRLVLGVFLVVESGRNLVRSDLALMAMTAGVVLGEFLFYAAAHLVIVRFGKTA